MKIRLHQFLSKTGNFKSKDEIILSIRKGEITVGGQTITSTMFSFDPDKKRVFWKGRFLRPVKKKIYLALNKPEGCLSSRLTTDDIMLHKRGIFDLISTIDLTEEEEKTLFCVGRLDEDTSGLIIITNDGDLSHKITDPNNRIEKTYNVKLQEPISKAEIAELEKGVVIQLEENGRVTNYKTGGCRMNSISSDGHQVVLSITEGKKREVKRIFESVGNRVLELQRVAIGKLALRNLNLKIGECKIIENELVEKLILKSVP
jgi:pseudouridine synthase